jgi:hypothetical protein
MERRKDAGAIFSSGECPMTPVGSARNRSSPGAARSTLPRTAVAIFVRSGPLKLSANRLGCLVIAQDGGVENNGDCIFW